MNLGFSTHIDGKPTYFIDKIWASFPVNGDTFYSESAWELYVDGYFKKFKDMPFKLHEPSIKIHTIREDKTNRWKVGSNIHFVINNRTKNRFQFAPVVPVVRIQFIKISYIPGSIFPLILILDEGTLKNVLDPIENHFEYITQISDLAQNDGFDSWQEFLKYFNQDYFGKIIHWTDFKY
jgi:hypothetical protein